MRRAVWKAIQVASATAALAAALPALPQEQRMKSALLKVIEVKEAGGQILSYRHIGGSLEIEMRGTHLAPEARVKLKVGSRPGFVEIDINRGHISGLKPAPGLGMDFLTYVLWAVSVDGKASNLGEITFDGDRPISVNVTTPYQTFWLMVTAEPDYAVVDPSPCVVLYSSNHGIREAPEKKALAIRSDLFYFTHYTAYGSSPASIVEKAPSELLQARKAVELASKSGILAVGRSAAAEAKEEGHTREALKQARAFLAQAEELYRKNPRGADVIQFARTAAQIAENARALALGAVGGILVRQLENELALMRNELAKLQAELARIRGERPSEPARGDERSEAPQASARVAAAPALETKPNNAPPRPISHRIVWFGALGWTVALLLLFRRRSA